MPILSRRVTQSLINENSAFIPRDVLTILIAKLNTGNVESLNTLWEIIVLNLLSKNGSISYEANHGGTSRPDIHFRSHRFEMISDITCISDQDSVNKNDIDYFANEFLAVARKFGIQSLAGFNFQFEGAHEWRKKVKLKLPAKQSARKFIEDRLKPFILAIAKQPGLYQKTEIKDNDVIISVAYTPGETNFSMGYPVFTQATTHQGNVLYNRLNTKREQLKKSGFDGLKGVFICDAGCDLFQRKDDGYGSYGNSSIINNFLRSQDTISFVFMLHVSQKRKGIFGNELIRNFELNTFSKQRCYSEIGDLASSLKISLAEFARPEKDAKNAVNVLKAGHSLPGADFYGGYRMTENQIRVSLRTVLRLISGEITHEKFLNDHGHMGQILLNKIISGYPLASLKIIKEKDHDDDWLELSFESAPDAALHPYV